MFQSARAQGEPDIERLDVARSQSRWVRSHGYSRDRAPIYSDGRLPTVLQRQNDAMAVHRIGEWAFVGFDSAQSLEE